MTKERKLINLFDKESKNLKDDFIAPGSPRKGFVSVIDKDSGEYLVKNQECKFGGTGKNNLIVWNGREIIPQILFGRDRDAMSNQSLLKIRYMSFGIGGADAVHPMDPIAPDSPDIQLNDEVVINAGNIAYPNNGRKKPFDGPVQFLQDDENDNRWLVSQVTTTLLYEEANDQDINEAGMWLSDSSDPTLATVFELFARVTFSTIRKHSARELVFLWYFYF